MNETQGIELPRRRVMLASVGVVGAVGAAAVLAGCGSSTGPSSGSDSPTGSTSDGGSTGTGGNGGTGAASAIKTSDIPAGGGKVFPEQNLVVTQPTAGTFKAFSATCTHQGCKVNKVENGAIECPCHGTQYSITDGSVKQGPAPRPLPSRTVSVNGDSLSVS